MPRYRRDNETWDIEINGRTVTTRLARDGREIDVSASDFESEAGARWAFDRQVAEHLVEGWSRDLASGELRSARHPDIESQIASDPDDPHNYLVYADWLQSQGDPRAELISIHHAIAKEQEGLLNPSMADSKPHYRALRRTELALIHQHRVKLFSPELAEIQDVDRQWYFSDLFLSEWFYGFIQAAQFRPVGSSRLSAKRGALLTAFLESATAQFLRELQVDWIDVPTMIATPPRVLRRLRIRCGPEFERDSLFGEALQIPHEVYDELLDVAVEEATASAEAVDQRLQALDLVLNGNALAELRELTLMHCRFADSLVERLLRCTLIDQLEHLDLSGGSLSDDGAIAMSRHPHIFGHLKYLDLRGNWLTMKGVAAVRNLCAEVRVSARE